MDKSSYEEKYRLRISDFDCYDRITPCCILDLAQDIAGKHADILGIGYQDFIVNNRIWVLLRTRYEMVKYPPLYSILSVKTWPREKGRVDFDRDTLIKDENGDIVCKVQSKWVIIDSEKRRLVLPRQYNYPLDTFLKEKTFDTSFDKLDDFNIEDAPCFSFETSFLDLDHNGHVNNVSYVKYILDCIKLDSKYQISSLEINYIHEIKAYEKLNIYIKRENDIYFVKGVASDETVFIAKITIKLK